MVSIRRRKLLVKCPGLRNSFLAPLPKFSEIGYTPEITKPVTVHPLPSSDMEESEEKPSPLKGHEASEMPALKSQEEQHTLTFPEVKRRKRHRRKHFENQEACVMRGVYFKNMKWQAAIKVDKKQIHLGTVGSQEEAARLYDRAAFMCGREPNFELSEEEKRELRKFKWEEFLEMTRSAITHKKHHRRAGVGPRRKSDALSSKGEWESEQAGNNPSGSEDVPEELDSSDS
ncbi:OLC1v1006733C1 [Oldenlandia corymbosa var. corymbosa]|uniref:OLC1v1006733C1 n=1 Tax=Oldenlandia corymbosa var. corymbosa TaxID=529605 RepID=A0AAV1DJ66_OLDCO|nr:OLC1v1006733C1 [Oldenlandia corymbosa var. corymbosa]